MKWTDVQPSRPGWYWWRTRPDDTRPWVVKVQRLGFGMMQMYRVGCEVPTIIGDGGEWLGPLYPEEK